MKCEGGLREELIQGGLKDQTRVLRASSIDYIAAAAELKLLVVWCEGGEEEEKEKEEEEGRERENFGSIEKLVSLKATRAKERRCTDIHADLLTLFYYVGWLSVT